MIREVKTEDAVQICDIYNYYVNETTVTFETQPISVAEMRQRIVDVSSASPYFVFEEQGEVLGYCYIHPWKAFSAYSHTYETTIYLSPKSKGRGIGSMLMRELIKASRSKGAHVLIACITADNIESIEFHKCLGFSQSSLFKEVGLKFGKLLDVIDLQLTL